VETLQQLEAVREELRLSVIQKDSINSQLRRTEQLCGEAKADSENLRKAEAKREVIHSCFYCFMSCVGTVRVSR